jgi:hypothetical protein
VPEDFVKVRVLHFEQLDEEVFQVHFVVGLGQTQAGGRLQGAAASLV